MFVNALIWFFKIPSIVEITKNWTHLFCRIDTCLKNFSSSILVFFGYISWLQMESKQNEIIVSIENEMVLNGNEMNVEREIVGK